MNSRIEIWLFIAQRASAAILAPLIIIHLATMIYAVQGGLSAKEIVDRTEGSFIWGTIYGLFVAMVAVHAPIGMRSIIREITPWRGKSLDWAAVFFFVLIAVLGIRAIWLLI